MNTETMLRERIEILERENRHLSHRNAELELTLSQAINANRGLEQSQRHAWDLVARAKAMLAGACALVLLFVFAPAASAQAAHSVTLNWSWTQGTGGAATGFQIQRATVAGGPYTTVGTVTSSSTLTFVDASAAGNVLTEGQKYCYVVETTGNGGTVSGPSNEACGTIPFSVPSTPTGLSLTVK